MTRQDLKACQNIQPDLIQELLRLEIFDFTEAFAGRLQTLVIMLEVEITCDRSVAQGMEGIIKDMALPDPGGNLIEIDIVDIRARETDLLEAFVQPADQMLEIREGVLGIIRPSGFCWGMMNPVTKDVSPYLV